MIYAKIVNIHLVTSLPQMFYQNIITRQLWSKELAMHINLVNKTGRDQEKPMVP